MSRLLRYLVLAVMPSFVSLAADAQSGRPAQRAEKKASPTVQRQPAQPARRVLHTGHIQIITDPPGFEILVNGSKRPERTNAVLELTEGRYQIELFLPATSYRQSFAIEMLPADVLIHRFDMRGSLRVDSFWVQDGKKSEGPALELFLDGKPISQGKPIDKVVAGTHDLLVRYGGMKKTQRVDIRPGSALQVNYSVERRWDADPGRVPN